MERSLSSNGPTRVEEAQSIARERGGCLLSSTVPNGKTLLSWKCAEGHQWEARLQKIKGGTWCPICAGKGPVTIEDMRQLAAERLGQCVSAVYTNNSARLLWRCHKMHEWWARPGDIRRSWCPVCARTQKLELGDLRSLARSRGGALLSKDYVSNWEPLLWRCHNGHRWHAAAASVKPGRFSKGSWCPLCPRRNPGKPSRLTIEEMQALAISRGGVCLSKHYVNSMTKLQWRCANGHEWEAQPASVKQGTWCAACSGKLKLNLESLQELARERCGELISTEYLRCHAPLLWRCEEGHQWSASASKIKSGRWCPNCAGKAPLTIEEMQELARTRGGECLSKRYVNGRVPLKWRCAQGHEWHAEPLTVKPSGYQERGTWCPVCAIQPKYTLEDMQAMAASRGGKCLSQAYLNSETPMLWRCAKGHTWEAVPNTIRAYSPKTKGCWCPECAHEKRKLTIEDMT